MTSRTSSQLVRDRTFGPCLAANVVSNIGNRLQNVAAGGQDQGGGSKPNAGLVVG